MVQRENAWQSLSIFYFGNPWNSLPDDAAYAVLEVPHPAQQLTLAQLLNFPWVKVILILSNLTRILRQAVDSFFLQYPSPVYECL